MSVRSPLGRVLGSGSAKEGTDHWWMQRVSAVALAVLGLWFLVALLGMDDFSQAALQAWVGTPLNALLLSLLAVALAYHSSLGVQVVIEDYVHGSFAKIVSLLLNRYAHIVVAAAAVFAVLRTAFGTN